MAQLQIPLDAKRFATGLTWKDYMAQMGDTRARTEQNYANSKLTDEEQKFFSGVTGVKYVMMLAENLYSHKDGSKGVHNPFFYEALLAASIGAVEAEYGAYLPAPPSPEVRALMQKALSRPGVRYSPRSGQLSLGGAR